MADNPIITLSHYDRGPMKVQVWDTASVWEGKRTWTCPDAPELGSFDDGDFDEHYTGEIDAILSVSFAVAESIAKSGIGR